MKHGHEALGYLETPHVGWRGGRRGRRAVGGHRAAPKANDVRELQAQLRGEGVYLHSAGARAAA
jgi:hypothetical protein